MARQRRYLKGIMVVAVLVAIGLGMSYFYARYSASIEGDGPIPSQSLSKTDTNSELGDNLATTAGQVSQPSSEQPSKAQSDKESGAQQRESVEEESARDEPAEDELDEFRVAGAVFDDAGQLVQGANVAARAIKNAEQDDAAPEIPSGQNSRTTDQLGAFEFTNLEEGEYELLASKGEDYFPARLNVRTGMANAELVMQRLRTIRVYGEISDDFGNPLDGVTVRTLGTSFRVESESNGSYEISTAPMKAGAPPVLEFNREGFQEARRRIETALDSEQDEVRLDVKMEEDSNRPKVAVAGQVLGPTGEAVVGVRVTLKSFKYGRGYSARTDESGEFSIPKAEVGEGYRLNVAPSEDYEAYQSEAFSLDQQDMFFEIELEAAKSASLSGTVTDLYGKPLRDFQLWLRGIGISAQSPVGIKTDVTGRFKLENLRAGEVVLETRSRPLLRASEIVLQPDEHKDVNIPLDWGNAWLLGQVVDAEGNPVSGASVTVTWKAELHELTSDSRRDLRSDLAGYFTASNLAADNYTVTVRATGYQTFRSDYQLGDAADELVIELQ